MIVVLYIDDNRESYVYIMIHNVTWSWYHDGYFCFHVFCWQIMTINDVYRSLVSDVTMIPHIQKQPRGLMRPSGFSVTHDLDLYTLRK